MHSALRLTGAEERLPFQNVPGRREYGVLVPTATSSIRLIALRRRLGECGRRFRSAGAVAVAVASIAGFAGLSASAAGSGTPSLQRACRSLLLTSRPQAAGALIPTTVSANYGVLRRAQVPADRLLSNAALANALSGSLSAYDPSAERRLASVPGGVLYLVSGTAFRFHVSAACRRALPAPLRVDTRLPVRAAGHRPGLLPSTARRQRFLQQSLLRQLRRRDDRLSVRDRAE